MRGTPSRPDDRNDLSGFRRGRREPGSGRRRSTSLEGTPRCLNVLWKVYSLVLTAQTTVEWAGEGGEEKRRDWRRPPISRDAEEHLFKRLLWPGLAAP